MDNLARALWTLEQYRAHEEASEVRHEFYAGQIFEMALSSPGHAFIKDNLAGVLFARLKGSLCRGATADLRVRVATGFHTYPDYLVFCGKGEFAADDPYSLLDPLVIVEILSPSTEKHDRTFKMDHYRRIPSLTQYILVAQDAMAVEVYTPAESGWSREVFLDPESVVTIPPTNVTISLAEIYDGIDFEGPG